MSEPETILFVDDDAMIRRVAELSLRGIGKFRVVVAKSGEEALALAASETPDLIMLDVMMPDLDGLETFRRLRANEATRDVPTIFITAKSQPTAVAEYLRMGAIGVIRKPFDPVSLPAEVRALLRR